MADHRPFDRDQPFVFLASAGSDPHWLERTLVSRGFIVIRLGSTAELLDRLATFPPDLLALDADTLDAPIPEACRALREDVVVTAATPLVVTSARPMTRYDRVAALKAGAWDCIQPDSDADELEIRFRAYVRAKREGDRARSAGLTDQETNFYNRRGLARRLDELGANAFRTHDALACVAFSVNPRGEAPPDAVVQCVPILREGGRISDVIARLGPAEFVVVAPHTGTDGAARLAERLGDALRGGAAESALAVMSLAVEAGYDAVENLGYSPIRPFDLVGRAMTALRVGQPDPRRAWIRRLAAPVVPEGALLV